jgi:hypothetical protein
MNSVQRSLYIKNLKKSSTIAWLGTNLVVLCGVVGDCFVVKVLPFPKKETKGTRC